MFQINLGVKVVTPPPPVVEATNIIFTPAAGSFDGPVSIGTTMGTFTVEPPEWVGSVSMAGDDAASFAALTDGRVINVVELEDRVPGDDPDYNFGLVASP